MPPLWILADAHAGSDPSADADLLRLLDRALAAQANLLILGDLFRAWLARPRFFTPLQREVIARLRRLERVELVVGNRDYLIEGSNLFDRIYEDESVIDLGGIPTLIAHGDLTNPSDRLYRAWHALSRSAIATRLLESLPTALATRLTAQTEQALSTTNTTYKTGDLPIPALESLGRRAQTKGAQRALIGHYHHDRTLDVPNGGVPVIIAPAWLDHRRILRVEPDGTLTSLHQDNVR